MVGAAVLACVAQGAVLMFTFLVGLQWGGLTAWAAPEAGEREKHVIVRVFETPDHRT